MKFRENAINPGMVIHCPKEEDARALSEYLIKLGAVNANRIMEHYGLDNGVGKIDTVLITRREGNLYVEYSDRRWFEKDEYHMKITEFSDLIEPEANKANDLANSLDNQDNVLDNQRDNEMSAVEVVEWFKHLYQSDDYNNAFPDMLDGYGISDLFEKYSPQEIVDKIIAYEAAKKAPEPVEAEFGWHCEIFDKGRVLDEKEIWEGDEEHAKDEAAERAEQYVVENGGIACYRVWGICRVKEDK